MSEFHFLSLSEFEFSTNNNHNNIIKNNKTLKTLLNLSVVDDSHDFSTQQIITNTNISTTQLLQHHSDYHYPEELSTELNVPYTIFEILVAIIAIIGNLMVIIVFQRDKKLRRRTNYYIVSLAIADFLVGLLGVPFAILASVGLPTNLHLCLFTVSLLVVLCTISIFCLVAVSIDRYWAILYPMAYSRNVRTKTAIGIISMCYVAGTFVGFLPLLGWHANVGENQACLFVKVMDYSYLVFLYFATIITPAILLLAFYAHIYRVIVKQIRQRSTMNALGESHSSRRSSGSHQQHPTRQSSFISSHYSMRPCGGGDRDAGTMLRVLGAARKRDVKATQNLSIIVLFFMICWIPLYTINCIKAFCPECYVHPKLTFFCIILSHLNSAVNPVLYAYHLKDFRAALKNLILKILGIEVEQPPDMQFRFSLASQHRMNSLMDKRTSSLQNRIYIDSPIWLRQQQQRKQQLAMSNQSPLACSLNSVHQTMAAVASSTAEINREIWNIVEVPSCVEVNSHFLQNQDTDEHSSINYTLPNSNNSSSSCSHESNQHHKTEQDNNNYQFSYDNISFSSSQKNLPQSNNDSDEVLTPISEQQRKLSSLQIYVRERLKNDEQDYLKLSISDSFNTSYDDITPPLTTIPIISSTSSSSISTKHSKNNFLSNDMDKKTLSPRQSKNITITKTKTTISKIDRNDYHCQQRTLDDVDCSNISSNDICINDKCNPIKKTVSNLLFQSKTKTTSLFHISEFTKEGHARQRRTSADS